MDILDELECISTKTASEKVVEESSNMTIPVGRYVLWTTLRSRGDVGEYRDRVDYIFSASPFVGSYTCIKIEDDSEEMIEYAGFSIPATPLLTVMVMFDYNAINAGAVYHLIEKLRQAGIIDQQRDPHMIYIPEQYTYNYMFRSMSLSITGSEKAIDVCDGTTFKYLDACKMMVDDYYRQRNMAYDDCDLRIKFDVDYLKMWDNSYKPLYQQHAKYVDGKIHYEFGVDDPFYNANVKFCLVGRDLHELYVRFGIFTNMLTNFIYFAHQEEMAYTLDPSATPVYVPQRYTVTGFNPQALIFKLSRGGRMNSLVDFGTYDFDAAIVDLLQKYTLHKQNYQSGTPRDSLAAADMQFLSDYINNIDIDNFKRKDDGFTG